MSIFSNRLKEIRKERNFTQKNVADHLGIAERAYQNYEYGKREPNLKTLIKLANYFDVTLDFLSGRSDT
ncbi:MAG: helix-turn-helix transcriptional regulator [Lachnospiraceae bacterium]|nr:helix-turn-helix transcriptional regulator [Lachnospiraceae bacterium]